MVIIWQFAFGSNPGSHCLMFSIFICEFTTTYISIVCEVPNLHWSRAGTISFWEEDCAQQWDLYRQGCIQLLALIHIIYRLFIDPLFIDILASHFNFTTLKRVIKFVNCLFVFLYNTVFTYICKYIICKINIIWDKRPEVLIV